MRFQVYFYTKSLPRKGNRVCEEDKASTPLKRYHLSFVATPLTLQIGIILHSYLLVPMGWKGSQSLHFGD
jgi:hypothetical protein